MILVGWSFCRMVRQTWKPFDFGMSKSHKITSGRFRRASSTPESPSAASKTFQFVRAYHLDRARRPSSSSSMINTLGISLLPLYFSLSAFSFSAFLRARSFVRRDLATHAARLTDNANELRENTDCAGWLLVSAFQFSDF